ncbi:MAG: Holliday junction resolvase Hjc [Candidatus Woesearchaeota archaeon]
MTKKSRGISAERELLHRFWDNGWIAMRAPASGSIRYPCPDLLVGNALRKLAIECKTTRSDKQYVSEEQIENLKRFSSVFAAEAWLAVRFDRHERGEWFFLSLEDLKKTRGNNYVVSLEEARNKGLFLSEILGENKTV